MKNKILINPIGLKGNELHERQLALMGIKPINENENKNNYAVELTKIGPDGNAYAIVRENHEYFIKKTNKTTGLVLEDFKYIGGLQNKKDEAYPSYAKAIKQLNLKFKSLAEAYNKGSEINVFEDDNLLSEHHPLKSDMDLSAKKGIGDNQEYVVDKAGTPLSNKAKEGKEEGQFGDNVADKKVADEFEKVNEGFGFGFKQEGMFGENLELTEEELAIQEMMDRYNEEEEMSARNKELAAMIPPYDKITHGDKLKAIGVFEGDEMTTEKDAVNTLSYHLNVYDKFQSEETKELLVKDLKKLLNILVKSSVKPDAGPYGHSLEESIERLNSLLDGELKKKALK